MSNIASSPGELFFDGYMFGGSSGLLSNQTNSNSYLHEYFDLLKDTDLVDALIQVFESQVVEAIEESPIKIKINTTKKNNEITEKLNKRLEELDIKNFLLKHLHDNILWRGSLTVQIKDNKLVKISNKAFSLILDQVEEGNKVLINNEYIENSASYGYKFKVIKELTKNDIKELLEKKSSKDESNANYLSQFLGISSIDSEFLRTDTSTNEINGYLLQAKSLFEGQIYKIFNLYVNNLLYNWKIATGITRKNIITMDVNSKYQRNRSVDSISNNIERKLNEPYNNIIFAYGSPINYLGRLREVMANPYSVLPVKSDYSNLQNMDLNSPNNDKEQLSSDIQKEREELNKALGIPNELFEGNSNRYEVMSRNEAFTSKIKTILNSISRFVEDIGYLLLTDKEKKSIPRSALSVSFEETSFWSMLRSKGDSNDPAKEQINLVAETTKALRALLSTNGVDVKKVLEHYQSNSGMISPEIREMINFNELKAKSNKNKEKEEEGYLDKFNDNVDEDEDDEW